MAASASCASISTRSSASAAWASRLAAPESASAPGVQRPLARPLQGPDAAAELRPRPSPARRRGPKRYRPGPSPRRQQRALLGQPRLLALARVEPFEFGQAEAELLGVLGGPGRASACSASNAARASRRPDQAAAVVFSAGAQSPIRRQAGGGGCGRPAGRPSRAGRAPPAAGRPAPCSTADAGGLVVDEGARCGRRRRAVRRRTRSSPRVGGQPLSSR